MEVRESMGGVMTTATATTSTTEGEELQLFLPTLPLVFFIQCEHEVPNFPLFLPLSLSLFATTKIDDCRARWRW
jgi:hypothetical protein